MRCPNWGCQARIENGRIAPIWSSSWSMQNRIREFRQRAGLSMQALADRAGTSAPQINKLEKGERRLTVDWMVRLGRALGVDPTDLLPPDIARGAGGGAGAGEPRLPESVKATPIEINQADLP